MSPLEVLRLDEPSGFPRVSGDEPGEPAEFVAIHEFSPRERG